MIDSALGLDPDDDGEEAKAKRRLRGLADLDGIAFVAKITVEPSNDPRYPDKNKLDRPVLPNEKEWRAVMNGEDLAPSPSRPRSAGSGAGGAATAAKPAWGQQPAKPAQQTTSPRLLWRHGSGRQHRSSARILARPAGEARRPGVAEPVTRSAEWLGQTSFAPSTDSKSAGGASAARALAAVAGAGSRVGVRPALRDLPSRGQRLRLRPPAPARPLPDLSFCSLRCLDAGAAIAGRHGGVIDKTEMEQQAIKDARRPFAEALTELGLMQHFLDLSAEQIDQLIEAAVDGFQQSMQCQALNDDVPW